MSKSSLKKGMGSSCFNINLEDALRDTNLPFYSSMDIDKDIYYEEFSNIVEARNYRNRKRNNSSCSLKIDEATKGELVRESEIKRKGRSKHIKVYYQGVMNTRGWIYFKSSSQYTIGKKYTQYIRLNESKDFKHFKEFKKRDIVKLFMFGDISVFCSCPDFKYRGYKYMAHSMGYGIYKEERFPKIRNPKLDGSLCKHLIAVLSVFGVHWSSIARDMVKTRYWKKRYDTDDY